MGLLDTLLHGGLDLAGRSSGLMSGLEALGRGGSAGLPSWVGRAAEAAAPVGVGAGIGAGGSLLGSAFGLLDAPRQALWSVLPGLHDEEGQAKDTGQAGSDLLEALHLGGGDPSSLGSTLAGLGLSVATDPLTLLGGAAGGAAKGIKAGEEAYQTARGVTTGLKGLASEKEALGGLKGLAEAAAAKAPKPGMVELAGHELPADEVKAMLVRGDPKELKKFGTVYNRYDPQFGTQLADQGFAHKLNMPNQRGLPPMFIPRDAGETIAARGGTPQISAGRLGLDFNGPLDALSNPPSPVSLRQAVISNVAREGGDTSQALEELISRLPLTDPGARGELLAGSVHEAPGAIEGLLADLAARQGKLEGARDQAGLLTRLLMRRMGG